MNQFLVFACAIICFQNVAASRPLVINDCSAHSSSAGIKLRSASINPHPIPVPGVLTASAELQVNRGFQSGAYDLQSSIRKRVGLFWIPVPCFSRVGSCTYDACSLLTLYQVAGCPLQLYHSNIPCTCDTIVPGNYTMRSQNFQTSSPNHVWSWLVSGDYKVKLQLIERSTKAQIACFYAEISIRDPNACTGFLCNIFG